MQFGFDASRKIEMRRRKGEDNFAIAKAAMACGGGSDQLDDDADLAVCHHGEGARQGSAAASAASSR